MYREPWEKYRIEPSSHNNNTAASSSGRCCCGRYITLGEEYGGIRSSGYVCPECLHRKYIERD